MSRKAHFFSNSGEHATRAGLAEELRFSMVPERGLLSTIICNFSHLYCKERGKR